MLLICLIVEQSVVARCFIKATIISSSTQSTQICMNFLLHLYECKLSYKKHEKFPKTILNGQ